MEAGLEDVGTVCTSVSLELWRLGLVAFGRRKHETNFGVDKGDKAGAVAGRDGSEFSHGNGRLAQDRGKPHKQIKFSSFSVLEFISFLRMAARYFYYSTNWQIAVATESCISAKRLSISWLTRS